jgi:thiamine biosynthesis protein ThiS
MICVNQEEMAWEPGMTVQEVLDRRRYTFPMIVVKVNDELVRKEAYASYEIPDGADVKVIHLISGG